jgi:pyocin large subunit-like protein
VAHASVGGAGAAGGAGEGFIRLAAEDSWANSKTLARHFHDHGSDVGASSADEYAQQASNFLQDGIRQGLPTTIDADGTIRVYDQATNTFGAYRANGTVRTFYKPSSPNYWARQPGRPPWPA